MLSNVIPGGVIAVAFSADAKTCACVAGNEFNDVYVYQTSSHIITGILWHYSHNPMEAYSLLCRLVESVLFVVSKTSEKPKHK
jgi:hypothetical protein